jgi:hypothetical protein
MAIGHRPHGMRTAAVAAIWAVAQALVWATPVLATSYTYDCDTGSQPASQYHMYVHKETSQSTDEFNGVIGEATARDRATCFGESNTHSGYSAVFPANLQENLTGGGLVQVGFYEDSSMSNTVMVYTSSDHQAGQLSIANWYHSGGPVCTTCVYRFRIVGTTFPVTQIPAWEICIRNVSNAENYICEMIARTWVGYAKVAWWLNETKNSADAIGHTSTGNISLRWLQYRRENSATWMVRSGMGDEPSPYDYNNQGGCRHDPVPGHYHCKITTVVNPNDSVEAWTSLH